MTTQPSSISDVLRADLASRLLDAHNLQTVTNLKCMVIGDKGVGKTYLLRTARLPVLLAAFDPGGQDVLRNDIGRGAVLPLTHYQRNDAEAFDAWWKDTCDMLRGGLFNHVGTYCLDSLTTWGESLLANVLWKVAGKPRQGEKGGTHGPNMELQDWGTFLGEVTRYIKALLQLPCDVVITGHIQEDHDDVTGRIINNVMIPGQSSQRAPIWLSEVYYLMCQQPVGETQFDATGKVKPPALTRYLITRNDGRYKASTRLGAPDQGNFDLHETPDLKHLMRKAKLPVDDKPLLTESLLAEILGITGAQP